MPKFCQKNVNFLKKTMLSRHFFQIGHKISPALMPVFDKKMSILLKLHQFMGQKRQLNPLFFRFFTSEERLLSCSSFVKNIYSLKNTLFMCIYYIKKFLFSQKHNALFSFFFQIFHEKPYCHVHIWSIKRQFGQYYTIL